MRDEVIGVEVPETENEHLAGNLAADGEDTSPKAKHKGGRKPTDPSGEKRTEKIMLYLKLSSMDNLKILANTRGISVTEYVIRLIETAIKKRQDKINAFKALYTADYDDDI